MDGWIQYQPVYVLLNLVYILVQAEVCITLTAYRETAIISEARKTCKSNQYKLDFWTHHLAAWL